MANLLERSSLVLTPTAYNNGEALCIKPDDGSGDFDFSRNSAATRVNAQGLVENVQILSSNLVQNGDFSEEGVQEISNGSFSQEGVQLVTNGDFATDSNWNKGSGWSISGGKATSDGTQVSASYLSQTLSGISQGKQYITEFDIDVISGSFRFNTLGNNLIVTESGHYVIYSTSVSGITLYLEAQVGFTGSIDNVSVREVGQDWTLNTGWSIGENKAICNGTTANLIQSNVGTANKNFKLVFTISDYISGVVRPAFVGFYDESTDFSGNGTYTTYISSLTDLRFVFYSTSFNGSITNISVKEVGQNWTVINGTITDKYNASMTAYQSGIRVTPFSNTGTFKVTFDLEVTSGSCKFDAGGANNAIYTTSGTKEIIVTNTTKFEFNAFNLGWVGTLDNVSVIQVTSDTNLPRINYEGFSYQDALGSEEVVNGGFSNGQINWSVAGANATHIATFNGDTLRYQSDTTSPQLIVAQGNVLVVGKIYKITIDVKTLTSGSLKSDSLGGLNITPSVGVNTFYATATGTTFNITRATTNVDITIDNVSVKEYLGQEVVPDSGCGSWLFEPQSTNLIEYSNDYADAYWTVKANSSISSNAIISPDGNLNADKLVENTSSSTHYINKNSFVLISGVDYTYSVFAKAGERSSFWLRTINGVGDAYFDLSNGTITSGVGGFIEDYGNGWYRCSVSGTSTSTTGNPYIYLVKSGTTTNYLGDGTSGLYIYGFQVEQQSYATSYIPTSGSTVTRNQDLCTNGGSLASINSTEGTLYAEIAALADDLTYRILSLSNGTSVERIYMQYTNASNSISVVVKNGSVTQANIGFVLADETNFSKIAFKFKQNDFALWVNGVKVGTDTSGNTPIGLSELAFDSGTGNNPFFGKTKALAVWKEALSDSELQSLTTI